MQNQDDESCKCQQLIIVLEAIKKLRGKETQRLINAMGEISCSHTTFFLNISPPLIFHPIL
jgi:hypothetical protein